MVVKLKALLLARNFMLKRRNRFCEMAEMMKASLIRNKLEDEKLKQFIKERPEGIYEVVNDRIVLKAVLVTDTRFNK